MIFSPITKALKTGTGFVDLVCKMVGKAVVSVDGQSDTDWLATRIGRYRNPNGAFEDKLANGCWIQVSESSDGDMVVFYTDITDQKKREIKALGGEQHY